ncbi:metallophosphoesterase family protein [Thermofilum pendens]|uniref:Metallophosphoesterase n=1 Tax=Thermofilum pendens (strain DSM 2475 / Hrk 5) TaxID=368408 RepID=A1S175_THEPD|nr:metallophosphoesterase [Thermofilum pendens]ABL79205.1 metallophosphoesterase [Thermofilum pendens Hrk 5]
MRSEKALRKTCGLLIAFILVVLLLPAAPIAWAQPQLPGILKLSTVAPAKNVGLGKPAVVFPGGSFQVVFKDGYQPGAVASAYIYTVVYDSGLKIRNYTVSVSGSGSTYTVTLPSNVEGGLYDLVIKGQSTVEMPRSVWVLPSTPTKLRIVHVSDQHYGAGQPDVITGDMNRFAGYLVASLLGPDLVIDTGDIADTASEDQYAQAVSYEQAFLYSFPIFAVPGNHDHPPDNFYKYYGDTYWYRLIGDKLLVVGLFSPEQGYPPMEQLQWAGQVLESNKAVPVKIVLVHHPVFYFQGELKTRYDDQNVIAPYDPQKNPNSPVSSYWSTNMEAVRTFLRMVEDYRVNYVFSGHVHRDLFVKYTSTRTGSTTYFITITTLGMGSAIYDGLDYYVLDLSSGALDFPVKPSTFIGFANDTRKLAQNSIPVGIYPPRNNYGVSNQVFTPAVFLQSGNAYVFTVENRLPYLNLENNVVWCLPWAGDVNVKVLRAEGGADLQLLDKLVVRDKVYLALHVKLPYKGRLEVAVYNSPDTQPPSIKVKMMLPEKPQPGSTVNLFVEVSDQGWGVKNFTASYTAGGKEYQLTPQLYSPTTIAAPVTSYVYKLTIPPLENVQSVKLKFTAYDWSGNQAAGEYTVSYEAPPQQQVPQQPPANQTQQPSTPPQTQQPPVAEQPPAQEVKPAQPLSPLLLVGASLVVVAAAILVVALLRRRRE